MPKFKLKSQHFINGVLLEAGTEIGEGTSVPFSGRPSAEMEGLDDAGKKAVAERLKTFMEPFSKLPMTVAEDK